ncbi:2TM domain-containing protein [Lewinella cohaerens]|uniref:2TM domain-containing protein n=1 Tax=Lewinella cohaerens TaxID=70995 RepID=UPI0003771CC7|nr:2TM domain-containing protein [Lewinella cohaerens]
MENEDIYKEARKKVQAKKGFLYHFAAYVAIIGMLYAIIHLEGNGKMLPVIIVALSWGIGIAIHYLNVYGTENLDFLGISPNWEEEELEQEIEKLKKRRELKERIRKEKSLEDDLDNLELKEIEIRHKHQSE